MTPDPFTKVLGSFCSGLSEKLIWLAEEETPETAQLVAGMLLDAIRETIAHLLLCEYECERILGRA